MMFRRPTIRYGQTPEPDTPYRRARQAWDDRVGQVAVNSRNIWAIAMAEAGVIAVLAGALIWTNARGTVTPWIVAVDRLGEAQAVGPASGAYQPTDPQIAFHLARFIEAVRALPADPVVLRQNWLRAYDFTTDKGAQALNDYARVNDPFAQLGKTQVAVDVSSVIRASPDSFRLAWTERRYQDGALAATERWSAILTIAIRPPHDADHLKRNPLGVFVTAINWSKEFAQ
jgi:type IV secretion system protein VirB5